MRQLEREKALLQHKSLESHRKAESEADRKRCLENEGDTGLLDNQFINQWYLRAYDSLTLYYLIRRDLHSLCFISLRAVIILVWQMLRTNVT